MADVPRTPAVHGVLETCLYADDLEAARRFYAEVLGLPLVLGEPDRHVFFRCGASMLLIFNPERTSGSETHVPTHGCRAPVHVAFSMAPEEVAAWRARLAAHGVVIEDEIQRAGGVSLYFRDPAGNSLELATPSIWGLPDPQSR
jgi:catechol 2,3-dioxygenase-like lactoylglutathione lyase family enzyme